MMTDRAVLSALASHLRQRRQEIPNDHIIMQMSLDSEIEEVHERLSASSDTQAERTSLIFDGTPVDSSGGINAAFVLRATAEYIDAIMTLAASLEGPLSAVGPLPRQRTRHLILADVVHGSFGFELQYRPTLRTGPDPLLPEALRLGPKLLAATLAGDEELSAAAGNVDRRVLRCFHAFLTTVSEADATCRVATGVHQVTFTDPRQVREAANRLRQENLHEEVVRVSGALVGVLPNRRTFEFQVASTGQVISGSIGPQINAPQRLNDYLGQAIELSLCSRRIGTGRPHFQLREWPISTSLQTPVLQDRQECP